MEKNPLVSKLKASDTSASSSSSWIIFSLGDDLVPQTNDLILVSVRKHLLPSNRSDTERLNTIDAARYLFPF